MILELVIRGFDKMVFFGFLGRTLEETLNIEITLWSLMTAASGRRMGERKRGTNLILFSLYD